MFYDLYYVYRVSSPSAMKKIAQFKRKRTRDIAKVTRFAKQHGAIGVIRRNCYVCGVYASKPLAARSWLPLPPGKCYDLSAGEIAYRPRLATNCGRQVAGDMHQLPKVTDIDDGIAAALGFDRVTTHKRILQRPLAMQVGSQYFVFEPNVGEPLVREGCTLCRLSDYFLACEAEESKRTRKRTRKRKPQAT
jgi:hypothetical protein